MLLRWVIYRELEGECLGVYSKELSASGIWNTIDCIFSSTLINESCRRTIKRH